METMPLVSVPVITYNSSKTILETLESIKAQTYQNLELIISDDCSTDNTVIICKDWLSLNKDRFVRTLMLESPINTGISANGNRARAACKGEWIKDLAGDDLLLPECISTFVQFVTVHPDSIFVFCKLRTFGDEGDPHSSLEDIINLRNDEMSVMGANGQLDLVKKGLTPPAPCLFYNSEKSRQLGINNDERIKLIEDWPKWIQYLKSGNKFLFVDKCLVLYRIGGISTSHRWQSTSVFKSNRQVYYYYLFEEEYSIDKQATLDKIIEYECYLYDLLQRELMITDKIRTSAVYKLYRRLKIKGICRRR